MANASTVSVVRMHQTHVKHRVHSLQVLLDGIYKTQTLSLADWVTLEFTTAQPTDTVLSLNDAIGTKAGSPASLVPTFWQVCSTVCLVTRPGLGVRGRSSWETSRSVCLVTRPGLAPGVVGPSTVSTTNKIQILLIAGGQRPHRQASNLRERERFWR